MIYQKGQSKIVIYLAFAKRIIADNKGMKMNYTKFVEVTFKNQTWCSDSKGVLPPCATSLQANAKDIQGCSCSPIIATKAITTKVDVLEEQVLELLNSSMTASRYIIGNYCVRNYCTPSPLRYALT